MRERRQTSAPRVVLDRHNLFLDRLVSVVGFINRVAKSAGQIKQRSRFSPRLNYLAAFLLSVAPAYGVQVQSADTDLTLRSGASARDLIGLSLEELYNLDVIQLNVIGSHTHPAGQIMLGYEFMFMDMSGHRSGTNHVSVSDILKDFEAASTGMTMEEHMAEVMYAPTNQLTLMAMLPIKHMEMDMTMPSNPIVGQRHFTEISEGIGDLQITALYTLLGSVSKGNRLIINAGMSFPTGSIDEKNTIFGETFKLEYNMQLGSGTFDLRPGLTYLGESNKWAWGAQFFTTLRLGRNGNGYRYGNEYGLTGWLGYALTDWFAPSLRINGRIWENVHGSDPEIDPAFDAEGDPNRQGGRRVDLLLGANFFVPSGVFKRTRVMIEAGLPVYENLDGPQLSTRWLITAGLTYSF